MTDRVAHSSGWWLAGLLLLAAGLRIPGLFSDFWLDEIWTFKIAQGMGSAWDVFTAIRHSNNHHLNTLWFYVLGPLDGWIPYRLPALAAGVLTVALAWRIGARRSTWEAAVAAGLCTSSYLLVHYASEARGYALVAFFALASFDQLERFLEGRAWRNAAAFWTCAALGFLSHLMYLHVFVAAGAWVAFAAWHRGGLPLALRDGARLFVVPGLLLLGLYLVDIRHLKVGPGPELDALEVGVRALSYALGGPASGLLAARVATATLLFVAGAVLWWQRRGRDAWIFLAVVIFVSPAVAFWAMRPEVFFVRYFLLGTLFGLLALAAPLAQALARGGPWRWVTAALLSAFVLANGVHIARFYEYGRGDYLSTLQMIADSATSRLPTVGGDHRFRTFQVVQYYNRFLPEDRRLVYVEQEERPDWLLLHRIGPLGSYAAELHRGDTRYSLVKVAPYSDLSGWHWLVYRRDDRPAPHDGS
jgi:hypothetical protein